MEYLVSYNALPVLIAVYGVVFIGRQWGTFKNNISVKYLLTPLITILAILFVIIGAHTHGLTVYRSLILIGLGFSLIGDVILMTGNNKMLVFGLLYFLVTHLFYSMAFFILFHFQYWNIAVAALLVGLLIFWFKLFKGRTNGLELPVFVYMVIISVMIFFAVGLLGTTVNRQTIFIVSGAVLFYISDAVLGYNEFAGAIPHSSVIVWTLYAPSQLLLAFSCLY